MGKRSNQKFLELKERASLVYRELAKETGTSVGLWNNIIREDRLFNPETAKKFVDLVRRVDGVSEEEVNIFLDELFKERILKILEKDGYLDTPQTPNIHKIIELLKKWDPEKKSDTRYIMSTNSERNGLTIPELASIYIGLRSHLEGTDKKNLTKTGVKKRRSKRVKKSVGGGQQRSVLSFDDFALVSN